MKSIVAMTAAVIFWAVMGSAVFASIYDEFGVRPGDVVTNDIVVNYTVNGLPQPPRTDTVSFTVTHFPPNGTIRAFQAYPGSGDSEIFSIQPGQYSTTGLPGGPLAPLSPPLDTSGAQPVSPFTLPGNVQLQETLAIRQGTPVVFVIEDETLNIRYDVIDLIVVSLVDSVTGDQETLIFTETTPSSGVFVGWINSGDGMASNGDGMLQTAFGSVIEARYTDPLVADFTLAVNVDVVPPSPAGRVFDSRTGALLDGIRFTLIDVQTGQPAVVRSSDLRATVPASFETGETIEDSLGRSIPVEPGSFVFPFLDPGTYRIVLDEDQLYGGPSLVDFATLQGLSGAPWTLNQASLFEPFEIVAGAAFAFDVPLDPAIGDPMVVRLGSIDTGSIGEAFEYEVVITVPNTGLITFRDDLPFAIRFIPGTFTIDGQPWEPEVSEDGRSLIFRDVPVEAGVPMVLRYGARIGAESDTRSWTTLLTAPYEALRDDHVLELQDPFGLQDTVILGEILAGSCGAPIEDRDLSGIRVYLETGDYVLTDSRGLFTFRDIERRPRVVQVDERTLPEGSKLVLCTNNTRSAGSAISRFVDVGPGQMGRVDFRLEFDKSVEETLAEEAAQASAAAPELLRDFDRYSEEWFLSADISGPALLAPDAQSNVMSQALDIVFVRHRDQRAEILINGQLVRPSSAAPSVAKEGTVWVMEQWRGVRLRPGTSDVELVLRDSAGVIQFRQSEEITFATEIGRVEVVGIGESMEIQGGTRPKVRLLLTDYAGTPVRPGLQVQIGISQPYLIQQNPERDSAAQSERRAVEQASFTVLPGGFVDVNFAPVTAPGRATIWVGGSQGRIETDVRFRLDNQPWILVGLAEGTIAERTVRDNLHPLTSDDNHLAGRVAFFAEGVIQGRWLLTLRYDSDRPEGFYDIDPDKDYIVYGDRSVQGQDAQSRFPLYIRLRSDEAEFLLGDFKLDIETMLIRETRKVSGLRALYETDTFRALAFVAETDEQMVRDRIPLNGTIGPYRLTQTDIVPASESVTLIAVSRLDSTLESDGVSLTAGVDYVLDYATGRLFLRKPIGTFNEAFDRHVLIVDYEVDKEGSDSRLAGVRVEGEISPRLSAGATVMQATRVDGRNIVVTLAGLDIEYQINALSSVRAEVVEVEKDVEGQRYRSSAQEIRYDYESETTTAYARLRQQRGDIELTSKVSDEEIIIGQVGISHRLSGPADSPNLGTFVEGTATVERNRTTGEERDQIDVVRRHRNEQGAYGGGLSFSRTVDDMGVEVEEIAGIAQGARVSLDGRFREEIELRGVLYSTDDDPKDTLTFGIEYDVTDVVTIFTRFDGAVARSGDDMDSALTFGLKARPWDGFDGVLALTHAGANGISGTGLFVSATQELRVSEEAAWTFGLDAQKDFGANRVPFGGSLGNPYIAEDFVAARLGYRKTTETWSLGWDVEVRDADSADTANLRIRGDGEIGNDWTVGGEVFVGVEQPTGGERINDIEVRFAAAQRRVGREPITLIQAEIDSESGNGTDRNQVYISAIHNRFVGEKGEFSDRYAIKYTENELSMGTFSSVTQFAGLEYRHDINEQFDIGLQGSVMHDHATSLTQSSYGVSVGYTPFDNAWLSLGYNFQGFEDETFSKGGYTNGGPFLQFRLKFDQDTVKNMFR